MIIKEKLLKLRNKMLFLKSLVSRDYEFDALLEDHPIGEQNIYRLYYINYHRIREYDGRRDNNVGVINWPFEPFMLPKGMTREEGFKVLSYLTDFIEKREDTDPCSLKSVRTLDNVLNLERFGFTRVKEDDENKILNLFTVDGRQLLFKKSELYSKYFEWYIENVTLEEVKNIYAKYNMEFRDIVWIDNQNGEKKLGIEQSEQEDNAKANQQRTLKMTSNK